MTDPTNRPSSVPPLHPHTSTTFPSMHLRSIHNSRSRVSSVPPAGRVSRGAGTGAENGDMIALLQRSESSIVKTRSGSVLSRGFILKTDHYPSG
jgi:hypothetical protein